MGDGRKSYPAYVYARRFNARFSRVSQSRGPEEAGEHGSTMIRVDENGAINTYTLPTDSIRWIQQRVRIGASMSREDIRARFEDLAFGLISQSDGQLLLVDWQVAAEGGMNGKLHCNEWLSETNNWLRTEFGQVGGSLWSMGIRLLTPRSLPEEWFEEDTMLGDYLRSVREYQQGHYRKARSCPIR